MQWSGSKRHGQKLWKRGFFPRREFTCSERFDTFRVVADKKSWVDILAGEDTSCCVANCECARDANEAEKLEVCRHRFSNSLHLAAFFFANTCDAFFLKVRMGRRARACHCRHNLLRPAAHRSQGASGAFHLSHALHVISSTHVHYLSVRARD